MAINVLDEQINEQSTGVKRKASIYLGNNLIKEVFFVGNTFSDDSKPCLSMRFPTKEGIMSSDDVMIYGNNLSVIVEPVK